jgi:hypothetical protein
LEALEQDVATNPALLEVRIVAVNMASDANVPLPAGYSLPMAQDLPEIGMWATWGIQWRDLILVNENNEAVGIPDIPRNTLNLSFFDLQVPQNYQALKEILLVLANPADSNENGVADSLETELFGSLLEPGPLAPEQLQRFALEPELAPLQIDRLTEDGTIRAFLRARRRALGSIRPRVILEISKDGMAWSDNPVEILGEGALGPVVSTETLYDGSGTEWVKWSWGGLPDAILFRLRVESP